MNISTSGLFVASALKSVGCANAIARHDLPSAATFGWTRDHHSASDVPEQQPTKALSSASEYERCVLDELERAELSVGRR